MPSASRVCPACFSATSPANLVRRSILNAPSPTFLSLYQTPARHASSSGPRARKKDDASPRRKKTRTTYKVHDLREVLQFPLVDAMRYLRAAEVGRPPSEPKYELHIRLATARNGAVVRNRLRLPHPVRTDLRICVICPPDGKHAAAARAAGATVVGDEAVFAAVRDGRIEFDRCLCHVDSLAALAKSGVARILGPRGLMPSAKLNTVVRDVGASVRDMVGGSEYRERVGVVRMAVGQLGFSPEELQRNIRAFITAVKKDIVDISDRTPKEVHEVVLSSTHGPGLSLNGELRGPDSIPNRDVSTL